MNRGELFQRVNQKFIHVRKPCVSGPKGLVQCSRASSPPAVIPVTPGLPKKLPAHPLGMSYVHWNVWPSNGEEWVNVRTLWPTRGQFPSEREDPQSWWDPLLSVAEMDPPGSAPNPSLVKSSQPKAASLAKRVQWWNSAAAASGPLNLEIRMTPNTHF